MKLSRENIVFRLSHVLFALALILPLQGTFSSPLSTLTVFFLSLSDLSQSFKLLFTVFSRIDS